MPVASQSGLTEAAAIPPAESAALSSPALIHFVAVYFVRILSVLTAAVQMSPVLPYSAAPDGSDLKPMLPQSVPIHFAVPDGFDPVPLASQPGLTVAAVILPAESVVVSSSVRIHSVAVYFVWILSALTAAAQTLPVLTYSAASDGFDPVPAASQPGLTVAAVILPAESVVISSSVLIYPSVPDGSAPVPAASQSALILTAVFSLTEQNSPA